MTFVIIVLWIVVVFMFLMVLGIATSQRDLENLDRTYQTTIEGHSLRIKELEEAIGKPSDHSKPTGVSH